MKKFTKVCLILAAVFGVLGLVLFAAGRGLNGKFDSNPFLHFRKGVSIGWTEETMEKLSDYIKGEFFENDMEEENDKGSSPEGRKL